MDNKFLEQIRAWHLSERQSNIRRTFELGDLIITAVINTKLSENEVIRRIMADLGELAMGLTTYNRAARMARVFSQNQRAVLIEKLVSLDKAEILAGGFYDGRKRIKVISEIKSGKIKSPWGAIQGKYEVLGKPKKGINPVRDIVDTDSVNNPDNIVVRIKRDGEIDEESILNTLKNIVSRIGIDRFGRLAEQAKREVGAMTDDKPFGGVTFCKHGGRARKYHVCELESELAAANKRIVELEKQIYYLEQIALLVPVTKTTLA